MKPWDVVLPDPSLLYTDDVRYLAQFDRFAAQGVHHVPKRPLEDLLIIKK